MKRRIEICRKCRKFCHDEDGMICLVSNDPMGSLFHCISEILGIPKDFFFDEEEVARPIRENCFNEKDVPDDCEMKEVYLVDAWTNGEKA